jgi:outer membrane autotransporter protein
MSSLLALRAGSASRARHSRPCLRLAACVLAWWALLLTATSSLAGGPLVTVPFPGDLNQKAVPGAPLPNPLRVQVTGDVEVKWEITSDGTGGATLAGPGNLDTTVSDGSIYVRTVALGQIVGPTLTLGSSEGTVTVTACPAFEMPPGEFSCATTPVVFTAQTATLVQESGDGFRVERTEVLFIDVRAHDGGTSAAGPIPVNFSVSGPATAVTPTTSPSGSTFPASFQAQVNADAADNAVVTITATRGDVPAATTSFTFTVSEYLLVQTSPADGTPAEANSTLTLTVDATYNGAPPDNEFADRTITWEIVQNPNGSTLTGGLTQTTSETVGTTATIDLTVGAPNLTSAPVIVRATAFQPIFLPNANRRGAGTKGLPPPSANVRTVEFVVDPFDVLEVDGTSGDGQSAPLNTAFALPLEIVSTRNGDAEQGTLIDWTVSPPGAATLGATQTSSDSDGLSTNTVTAGSIGGPFTVTASRADDPAISYAFGLTALDRRLTKPPTGSGDGQTGNPGQTLPQPLVVIATNNGIGVGGVGVTWTASNGAILSSNNTVTGSDGSTSVSVTLPPNGGTVTVLASRDDSPGTTASFVVGEPQVLTIDKPADSGDGTVAPAGTDVELRALTLRNDDPEADVDVNWTVLSGDGRLRVFTSTSNRSGIARNTLTLPATAGETRVRAARADNPRDSELYIVTSTVASGDALTIVEGNGQVGLAGARGTPLGVRLTRDGVPVVGATVDWSRTSGSLTLDAAQSITDSDGVARVGFVFGNTPGAIAVRASSGNAEPAVFSLSIEGTSEGVGIRLVGGSGQSGAIGTRADLPIVVEVIDAQGNPVEGRRVDWEVFSGSALLDLPSTDTDANGRAQQGFRYGPGAGPIVIRASLSSSSLATVEATATSFVPNLLLVSGNNQSAPVSTTLPLDFVVQIAAPASKAKALDGVVIQWTVVEGNGTLTTATSLTDATGRAANRLTLGPNAGANRVTASIAGGGSVAFDATGTTTAGPLAIVSGNAQSIPTASDSAPFVIELRSANGQPVAGATIDWSATNASFVDDVESTVTDAQGRTSNRARVRMSGAATVTAQVRGSDSNRVTFTLEGRVANTPALNQPQETVANAIDNLCPALDGASNLSPAAQDLLARCRELVDNAGDNPDQVQDALDQLDQDIALALSNAALGGLSAQFDNLRQRLNQLRGGQGGVNLSGLSLATSSGMMPLSLLSTLLQDESEGGSAEVGADFGRWGFFASGTIGRAEQDAGSATPEYDYDTNGLTAGVDYRVNEAWVVGAALGYTQQDTELADGRGDVDAKGWSISGYSTWYNRTNWYLDGVLSFGSNDYDVRRSIVYDIVSAGGGLTRVDQVARASTDGDQFLVAISGGRDFQKGPWSFGPYLRWTYNRVEFDDYDEQLQSGVGSGLGLAVDSRELKSMTGVVGGKVSYAMSRDWGVLLPYAQLEWEHEFKDDPQQVVTRFLNDPTGTTIRLNGDAIDTDYFNIGFGMSALFPGGRSAFLYYERVAGSDGFSQDSLSLGVRIEF